MNLLDILTYKRPHGSRSEQEFVREAIDTLPGVRADGFGNRIVDIGDTRTLWSCHTDTVHRHGGRQTIRYGRSGYLSLSGRGGECLGADCGTGVWLMREMVLAGKPGRYVFHRGEERGCLGSKWIVSREPDLLNGVDFAIALDREGTSSVITHQLGRRTASEHFAGALCAQLPGTWPDPTGVYTDTQQYADIVPECTNLSVGYDRQHSASETQNYGFAMDLLETLLDLDTDRLPVARDPHAYGEPYGEYCWDCGDRIEDSLSGALHCSHCIGYHWSALDKTQNERLDS